LSEILDYLFLPDFGAALHMLKVEIGGEGLSTEGSEASHWRSRAEAPEFDRGYEWRLMLEAKRRNPAILLYGLPWTWPGWIAPGETSPFANVSAAVEYVVSWVAGAAATYNLTIDVLGVWNERPYSAAYVIALRAALDSAGFSGTHIVCDDGRYACVADMAIDPALAAAVAVVGGHGPPPSDALALGKPLWWTEDYHATQRFGDPAAWAFQINQRFLQNNCTSTLAWNALDAFLSGMDFDNSGLMVARWPWAGHYEVLAPVWATAHTTQFSRAGWRYLPRNAGGGDLALGGSYVTLVDAAAPVPTWSLVLEKMCGPPYPVCSAETAQFCVAGGLLPAGGASVTLTAWSSAFFGGDGANDTYLRRDPQPILVSAAQPCFTVSALANTMMTVTTTAWGGRGQHAAPPPAAPFPLQYTDDFSRCAPPAPALFFSDITGAYECAAAPAAPSGFVMRQRTPAPPISWERDYRPHGIIGDGGWVDVNVTVDAVFPAAAAGAVSGAATLMLAVRASFLNRTNYDALLAEIGSPGLWFTLASDGTWNVTTSIANATHASALLLAGVSPVPVPPQAPLPVSLVSAGASLHGFIGGKVAFQGLDVSAQPYTGFVGYGCVTYGQCADFTNLRINVTASTTARAP